MKEIKITEVGNVKIGNAQSFEGGTGCTVVICESGAPAGLDVRGGGPASRESELLKPTAAATKIHAVLLSGGSAFGLDAAGGVMQFLEEKGIGLPVGPVHVPLVCQSCIFDLGVKDSRIRPDKAMGYEACVDAFQSHYQDGNVGVGIGATVGKLNGPAQCMKSGLGSYAVDLGGLKIGALVVVNAVGDIYDWKNGQKIAGTLNPDRKTLAKKSFLLNQAEHPDYAVNTTLAVIITNARFNKTELCKIAGMGHNGYARSIYPVHTSMDGDSIYALSVGETEADVDMVGSLASEIVSEAIIRAVKSSDSLYGFPSWKEIVQK